MNARAVKIRQLALPIATKFTAWPVDPIRRADLAQVAGPRWLQAEVAVAWEVAVLPEANGFWMPQWALTGGQGGFLDDWGFIGMLLKSENSQ